jgi:hypothetical protein
MIDNKNVYTYLTGSLLTASIQTIKEPPISAALNDGGAHISLMWRDIRLLPPPHRRQYVIQLSLSIDIN